MIQRFTLSHSVLGSQVISEPDGWKKAKLKLERHDDYHSLVEYFDGSFIFYGSNGADIDGGFDFIRQVETTYGPDATINILIQISDDEVTYSNVFEGQLDLSLAEELLNNKIRVPIIRDDFWSKFINRRDTPVDLSSNTDLDGGTRSTIADVDLLLPSQKIRAKFKRTVNYDPNNDGLLSFGQLAGVGTTSYLIWDNTRNDFDEIEERYDYGTQISELLPTDVSKFIFLAKYGGTYDISASIRFYLVFGGSRNADVKWYLAVRQSGVLTVTQIGTTTTVVGATTAPDDGVKTITTSVDLQPGDEIYIYGELTLNSGTDVTYFADYDSDPGGPYAPVYTSLEVTANTIYKDTESQAFLIGDAANSILSKIIGVNSPLVSTSLFSGCSTYFALLKGLHLRTYTFTEKPFFMSFSEWWKGANPIFNLGLGYELSGSTPVIRIENKLHFYDDTISINFSNVRQIDRAYDNDYIFNKVEIGFNKWESENTSGIDDPQTKHTYATAFKKIGKAITLFSDFIAASLAIETTRRQEVDKSKDWKLDNDTFIVSVSDTLVGGKYTPELDENFDAIVNLLNSETRWNSRLTPARSFMRWRSYFNGALQQMLSSVYRFVSGQGNFDMTSDLDDADCDAAITGTGSLSEKQNISVSSDIMFFPQLFNITIPMGLDDYQQIDRKKAIGISQTETGHVPFFIKNLEYEIWKGQAVIQAWPKEEFNISVIDPETSNSCP